MQIALIVGYIIVLVLYAGFVEYRLYTIHDNHRKKMGFSCWEGHVLHRQLRIILHLLFTCLFVIWTFLILSLI